MLTKSLGCFWDTFGGDKGVTDTSNEGETGENLQNLYFWGLSPIFLSPCDPFIPIKSVPEAA